MCTIRLLYKHLPLPTLMPLHQKQAEWNVGQMTSHKTSMVWQHLIQKMKIRCMKAVSE